MKNKSPTPSLTNSNLMTGLISLLTLGGAVVIYVLLSMLGGLVFETSLFLELGAPIQSWPRCVLWPLGGLIVAVTAMAVLYSVGWIVRKLLHFS